MLQLTKNLQMKITIFQKKKRREKTVKGSNLGQEKKGDIWDE